MIVPHSRYHMPEELFRRRMRQAVVFYALCIAAMGAAVAFRIIHGPLS
jgi:hypothetical protein